MGILFCEKCGKKVDDREKYCGFCGALIYQRKPEISEEEIKISYDNFAEMINEATEEDIKELAEEPVSAEPDAKEKRLIEEAPSEEDTIL